MIERRFFVRPEALDPAGLNAHIEDEEHHHLSRVLRLRAGDDVSVFDGAGRGFRAVVEVTEHRRTRVRLTGPDDRAVEPDFRLTLLQGIPHHEKMDLIVQKTTELGVARVVPILGGRSVPRPGRDGRWARLERWRRIARDATRQSGRLKIPEVAEPIAWEELLEQLSAESPTARFLLDPVVDPREAPHRLVLPADAVEAMVAVGAEGGWTFREADQARARGFIGVGLGPRILRAETAGIVATALVLFLAGEMGPNECRDRRGTR